MNKQSIIVKKTNNLKNDIEKKLDEVDRYAKESSKRLSHKEVFDSIRKLYLKNNY